jgi:RNA polymerase sigma factor (sigma-70 family)
LNAPERDQPQFGLPPVQSFLTTHWSVVLSAGQPDSPGSARALEQLCLAYWYPLYAHIRRRGHQAEEARDLTQGFFVELLANRSVSVADPNRGRFRTFLLASLDNYLRHHHRDATALKRGGGIEFISRDAQAAEERYAREPADQRSPDREFDRRWALATLDKVRDQLRRELMVAGKAELFDLLRPYLCEDQQTTPYAQVAAQLKMTTVAVKVMVHRLRRRYGELLRTEVGQTLANPADADEELKHLIAALGN